MNGDSPGLQKNSKWNFFFNGKRVRTNYHYLNQHQGGPTWEEENTIVILPEPATSVPALIVRKEADAGISLAALAVEAAQGMSGAAVLTAHIGMTTLAVIRDMSRETGVQAPISGNTTQMLRLVTPHFLQNSSDMRRFQECRASMSATLIS